MCEQDRSDGKEGASVRLERRERGMPGRVTVAILSTACVLTLSPVSH